MKNIKRVLMGLDLGSDSVGWCVTDENGQIIKKNGKALWGYRGFDEAKAADERRTARCQRRRYNRRQERINLLRSIFKDEITKVDNSFFYRLDNSFYHNEDRQTKFDYTLFNDLSYTDSQYYEQYPTIYHLRQKLIHSDEKQDIRLIYLALHHMIKYRGNFLTERETFKVMDKNDADNLFEELKEALCTINNEEDKDESCTIDYSPSIYNKIKEINEENNYISVIKEKYNGYLNPNKDKYIKDVIIPLMVGSEVALSKLKLANIEGKEKEKLCVKSETFDQQVSDLLNENPNQDKLINAFIACKNIYDYFYLGKLLGKHHYISDAMVDRYNKHEEQLKALKKYINQNLPDKYDEVFRKCEDKLNNYAGYIGSSIVNGKKITKAHVTQKDFYDYIKKLLGIDGNYKGTDSYFLSILKDMENGEYLVRQNSSNNGVFPYQLNKMEMEEILNKQSKFYPFLLEKDEYGTKMEKIISILTFKIPYYVGPLISPKEGNTRSNHSWVIKTEEKIYPWTFDKVVNKDETAKAFITRMLSKCSYLHSCYCLPKNSILFSYFNVLNNLNKTYVGGCPINYDLKMRIINELFKKKRKVTKKMLKDYLKSIGIDNTELSTSNNKELKEFDFDMASYFDFSDVLGEDFVLSHLDLIENIIRDIVVFEDKSILVKRLESEYDIHNKAVINKIKGFNYTKYSSISRELLTDIKYIDSDNATGEVYSSETILSVMEKNNQNLQEVLYDEKYNFTKLITEYNQKHSPSSEYKNIEAYVDELSYVSPGMKRPMIQAYKICEEVEKILGRRIDEYYVECTRTNKDKNKGKTTNSRQKKLEEMYTEAMKIATGEMKKKLAEMKNTISELGKNNKNIFQSDKYYLYFTQMGKCMYTGKDIDISQLNDDAHYNIDHIYPQSLIKDDSLSNRVLVITQANEAKSDTYPIPQSILWANKGGYSQAYQFYKQLKKLGFISEEKYTRLTKTELTETDFDGFVNRQLVYTNQAVKGFINAIRELKTTDTFEPKIVYTKGENVSSFRNKYDIVKSRNANNFHHAHDAYLNIIVGRTIDEYFKFYQVKYGAHEYLKWMHDHGLTTNVMHIFDQNKKNTKNDIVMSDGSMIWSYENSLREIKHNIYERFDIFSTERTYKGNDLFGKITILPAGQGNVPVSTKGPLSDVAKYGGFKQYAFGSYSLIKVGNDYILESIPTVFAKDIDKYLSTKFDKYEVIIPYLNTNTVLMSGKKKYVITGKSGNNYVLKNKNERFFNCEQIHIIKKIEKLYEKKPAKVTGHESVEEFKILGFTCDENEIVISPAKSDKNKAIILSNNELISIYNEFINILQKDIFSYTASLSVQKMLIENKNIYFSLTFLGKVIVIMELLEFLKTNERKRIDLSLINCSSGTGEISINKKLKNCTIIYESITGFYQKKVFEIK